MKKIALVGGMSAVLSLVGVELTLAETWHLVQTDKPVFFLWTDVWAFAEFSQTILYDARFPEDARLHFPRRGDCDLRRV